MDLLSLLVALTVAVLVNVVVLYFVIKAAIKNALIEDRAFQAKVSKIRAANKAQPSHLSADGQ